jgi:hypothetical protein
MTIIQFLKAGFVWFIIAIIAIINGTFREEIPIPYLGQQVALPLSGLSLSIIVFVTTYTSYNVLKSLSQ